VRVCARHAQQGLFDHDRWVVDQLLHGVNASCKQICQQAPRMAAALACDG
jgi:hypothetical protein